MLRLLRESRGSSGTANDARRVDFDTLNDTVRTADVCTTPASFGVRSSGVGGL
jgi:hypothetical protein